MIFVNGIQVDIDTDFFLLNTDGEISITEETLPLEDVTEIGNTTTFGILHHDGPLEATINFDQTSSGDSAIEWGIDSPSAKLWINESGMTEFQSNTNISFKFGDSTFYFRTNEFAIVDSGLVDNTFKIEDQSTGGSGQPGLYIGQGFFNVHGYLTMADLTKDQQWGFSRITGKIQLNEKELKLPSIPSSSAPNQPKRSIYYNSDLGKLVFQQEDTPFTEHELY